MLFLLCLNSHNKITSFLKVQSLTQRQYIVYYLGLHSVTSFWKGKDKQETVIKSIEIPVPKSVEKLEKSEKKQFS